MSTVEKRVLGKRETREESETATRKKQCSVEKRWHAQKRTSSHKKHVYITEKYVFKGPYEKGSRRLDTVVGRHLFLGAILSDKTVQAPTLVDWEDGCYLRFPNVASLPPQDWKTEETSTLKGREKITLLQRRSMGIQLVSECVQELSDEQRCHVLYHLLLRFCLQPAIGDSHLGNMLYSGGRIYGVDLEETREKSEFRPVKELSEFVALLFKRRQRAEVILLLTQTLARNKALFIRKLLAAAKVASGNVLKDIKTLAPKADIHTAGTSARLSRCASLLSSLAPPPEKSAAAGTKIQ